MMDRKEIEKKIVELTCEQFGVTEDFIDITTDFRKDLHADSLDTVELVLMIEDEFDIAIPDEIVDTFSTISQIIDYVTARTSPQDQKLTVNCPCCGMILDIKIKKEGV